MDNIVTVNLGGEDRVVEYNMLTLWELAKTLECDPADVDKEFNKIFLENPIEALMHIVYAGIISHFKTNGNFKHGVTFPDVCKWIAQSDMDTLNKLKDAYVNGLKVPEVYNDRPQEQDDPTKKK